MAVSPRSITSPATWRKNLVNVTFSDAALQSINSASGPYTNGTYQPTNPLTTLAGGPVNGQYVLYIYDLQALNTGVLNSWSISVNSTKVATNQFQSGDRWIRTRTVLRIRTR